MHCFHRLSVEPDLFGGFALVTEWGRIGQGGRVERVCFSEASVAEAALSRQAARKYRLGHVCWGFAMGMMMSRYGSGATWPERIMWAIAATGGIAMVVIDDND